MKERLSSLLAQYLSGRGETREGKLPETKEVTIVFDEVPGDAPINRALKTAPTEKQQTLMADALRFRLRLVSKNQLSEYYVDEQTIFGKTLLTLRGGIIITLSDQGRELKVWPQMPQSIMAQSSSDPNHQPVVSVHALGRNTDAIETCRRRITDIVQQHTRQKMAKTKNNGVEIFFPASDKVAS